VVVRRELNPALSLGPPPTPTSCPIQLARNEAAAEKARAKVAADEARERAEQ
jgi:hypothetical protein